MTLLQKDLVGATAPIQVCAGLQGGVEAAVHAARECFEDPETEAIILVDAENAFNLLNREASLNNMYIVCPEVATYIMNTYRMPARLFIAGGDEHLFSEEGTTQGDPPAMGFYACGTIPLIDSGNIERKVTQIWYADDSAAGGKLEEMRKWWDNLCIKGPLFGYNPKSSKTWVIVKPEHEEKARNLFPDVNVTSIGRRYLGSFIGSDQGKEAFIEDKVQVWCRDLKQLSDIASREPQIAYSAYVYGLSKRWNYVCRTTPGVADRLTPLEQVTRDEFIPAIINRLFSCTDELRNIMALPPRYGGLGIPVMMDMADREYKFSCKATKLLKEAILNQDDNYTEDWTYSKGVKTEITTERNLFYKQKQAEIHQELESTPLAKLMFQLAAEKGASAWLTALPLKEYGYLMNKQQFSDAIALRYNLNLKDCPKTCTCGQKYSANHALICKLGGYVSLRHNSLRDTFADLMRTVKCKDVQTEPVLLPVDGLELPKGTVLGDQARLDISARSIWNASERAYFDVRVFHAPAPSNASKSIPAMYQSHENEKKRCYNARVLEVEKGSFTPLVFSTSGGMGGEAERLVKKLASKMEYHTGQRYSDAVGYIRKRLRFEILRTTVISLRGDRGARKNRVDIDSLDLNLEPKG